jgi:uncharacterized membrane protein SpoIIM required for sporulation
MVSRGPTDFMKKQFTEAARYARKARNFIYFGIAVFIVGVMAGIIFRERFDALLESFRIIAERFRGRSASTTIVMIFFRNVSSVVISILLGAFWGIVPLTAAIINGALVGIVISYGMKTGLMAVLGSLLPHGIFELPAIFLSWGMGLWLGAWPFRMDKHEKFCERMKGALQALFTFIVPLLMIAAVVEGLGIAGIH